MDGGRSGGPPASPGDRPGEPASAETGFRFPGSVRIRRGSEIRKLLRRGKRERTDHLDVFFAASPVSHSRWGLVVPKHGHEIVERNRLKRRLREIGRTEILPRLRREGRGTDVLVRARREAYDATFRTLRAELMEVTDRWFGES